MAVNKEKYVSRQGFESGIRRRVAEGVILNVLKNHGTFIVKGQAVPEVISDCLTAENECTNNLKNIGKNLPNDTASHPTRFESLTTLL
jgi:hypothetical protein